MPADRSQIPRPTRRQLQAARGKTLPDVIAPGLPLLFCGINPSLYSAAVGHHFARPGNRFWPALHRAAITDRQLDPAEDTHLPRYGAGLTNLVDRATARADELTDAELREGGQNLLEKIRRNRPRWVAFVGITAYRVAFDRPKAALGPQEDHPLGEAGVWVLPSTSGLNAHYQLPRLAALFRQLAEAAGLPGRTDNPHSPEP